MNILIAPAVFTHEYSSMALLSRQLIPALKQAGHQVSVCAPMPLSEEASFFPSPYCREPFHLFTLDYGRSAEEYLYAAGMLRKGFLREDLKYLEQALQKTEPDLVLNLGRPAMQILAEKKQIPVWSAVHSSLYRTRPFPRECLDDLNAILKDLKLDQVLHLSDLYAHSAKRIAFGPVQMQPFSDDSNLIRCGAVLPAQESVQFSKKLCIYFTETHTSAHKLHRIIREAFLGAPYEVYVWYPGCRPSKEENLHMLSELRQQNLAGSFVLIHDGTSFLFNTAMALGIPQAIISDGSYERSWNAAAGHRYGFAQVLQEDELAIGTLYETYRIVCSDDRYREKAADAAEPMHALNGLNPLLQAVNTL